MDSPPECVLALSCEHPLSPPAMPSLDHSPQAPLSPQSSPPSPQAALSPFPRPEANHEEDEEEEDDEEEPSAPASPTPAVALFPGEQEAHGASPESSPPAAPLPGFGALELALSAGPSAAAGASDELDLQLFHSEGAAGPGGAASGLRFPCLACGKRFRFQSILSLHSRAHSLDRDRRASALHRTAHLKPQRSRERSPPPELPGRGLPNEPPRTVRSPPLPTDAGAPPTEEAPARAPSAPPGQEPAPAATPPPAHRCHACKGKFRTASELERHVRILHNPYKCTLCPFAASQEERLAAHLRESHPPEEEPRLPTPPPPPPPTSRVATALDAVPPPPALPAFRCETCGQRFTQSWFLKGHMRKHKDSLDHKCQVCGRGFKEPWFLKNHMKVHLNKLGLKAGPGPLGAAGAEPPGKAPAGSQALGALYSNLLLARGLGAAGRGGARAEREGAGGSGKASILGYLGLPGDGASCVERLQAVAQVAEMGNGGGRGGEAADAGDQAAVWQLVARSLAAAQHSQQQQQQQRSCSQRQPRGSVAGEAEQVRAYLGGLGSREEPEGAPWECPDCGKLFRSLQQVVAHARVHVQRPQKGHGARAGAAREEEGMSRSAGTRGGGGTGGGRRGSGNESRQEPKQHQAGTGTAGSFHSVISHFPGENGLRGATSGPSSLTPRERVRGTGVKDCPYCGKAFRSSHHLKVHLRVHTGERPYKCPHCDYAGTQSGSLKYHLQRHHREQRSAMASSPSSASPSLAASLAASPRAEGSPKQRRPQGSFARAAGEAPSPRHGQAWPLGLPEQARERKAGGADLESQYRYLSGVVGALYPGALEGGWAAGEAPPPKVPKVSRRKPLTTSRMVPANGCRGGGGASRGSQEGGFEPLDLSRRPLPGMGAAEPDGGGGDARGGVTLNQCLFCPFRTSSAELMAMHLQVNHTSKSRRKRGAPAPRGDGSPRPAAAAAASDRDPLALWRFLGEGDEAGAAPPSGDWLARPRGGAENGMASGGAGGRAGRGRGEREEEEEDDEEEEDEEEEDEDEEEEEDDLEADSSSPGDFAQQQGVETALSLLPEGIREDVARREEGLTGD